MASPFWYYCKVDPYHMILYRFQNDISLVGGRFSAGTHKGNGDSSLFFARTAFASGEVEWPCCLLSYFLNVCEIGSRPKLWSIRTNQKEPLFYQESPDEKDFIESMSRRVVRALGHAIEHRNALGRSA
jgi:hypothetical protein